MNKYFYFSVVLMLLLSGCTQKPKSLYYWGEYYKSEQNTAGNEGNEVVKKDRITILQEIVTNDGKGKVAPGIYAEYAQLLYENGQKDEAKKYFLLEKSTYPESVIFIDRVIEKLYGEENEENN